MAYLKCALAGIVTGVAAVVTWLILRMVMADLPTTAPSGGTAAVIIAVRVQEILLAGLVGFAPGSYLMWRRQRPRMA